MVVTKEQAGKRPTIMGFPLMKTPRRESEKTSKCAGSGKRGREEAGAEHITPRPKTALSQQPPSVIDLELFIGLYKIRRSQPMQT